MGTELGGLVKEAGKLGASGGEGDALCARTKRLAGSLSGGRFNIGQAASCERPRPP